MTATERVARTMQWTEAQWDKYDSATVTISLELFDELCTALECFMAGKRPSEGDRLGWKPVHDEAEKHIAAAYDAVTRGRKP